MSHNAQRCNRFVNGPWFGLLSKVDIPVIVIL